MYKNNRKMQKAQKERTLFEKDNVSLYILIYA